MKLKNNRLIVVLGMHRSGTSVITRSLRVMSVGLGDRLMPPVEGNNAKGFWEDIDLNTLNIEMLSAVGSDWTHVRTIDSIDIETLHRQGYFFRAVELLREKVSSEPVFAFKDPRVAKLLPFWKDVFTHCNLDVDYVLAVRNPLSVVKSLMKRDALDSEQSYLLWLSYVITSLTCSAGKKRGFVDYDRLIQSPDHELNRIAKYLDLEINPSELQNYKTEFLDKDLRHTLYNPRDLLLDEACPPLVQEIYSVLLDVASDNVGFDELDSKVANWATELDRLKSTLMLIDKLLVNKVVAKQLIAERDAQLANLNQTVAERDAQLANLNQTVAERNQHYQECLSAFLNSKSWRLTRPLRFVLMQFRRISRIIRLLPSIIRHGNGITKTAIKAVRVFRNEGIEGIRRSLITMPQKSTTVKSIVDVSISLDKPASINKILQIDFDQTQNRYVEYVKNPSIKPSVKLIAFYLPQFHPFPENDKWWGKGFTEWTNVGKAKPNFLEHYQPHCPIHNGYYDLRVPEVMEEQARLAKEYGIYGFSYYFYWFGGKILMDTPLENMLTNRNVDIPFCFTWANENWSRRWDGQENDILIAQNHSDDDSLAFIRHLIKYFEDERYICIDGKPVLIVYRANIIPNIAKTAALWRDELFKAGFPGIYLVSAQSFGIKSPEQFNFDASVEFPPHTVMSEDITNKINLINKNYNGHIYDYEQVAANAILSKEPEYKLFRTAMLSWDNTARKQNNSHIFHNFTLLRYKQWLSSIVNKVDSNPKYTTDEKIVFVNAWNEWAEGTHLEPDQKFGYGYLQTTYDVLRDYEPFELSEAKKLHVPKKRSNSTPTLCRIVVKYP